MLAVVLLAVVLVGIGLPGAAATTTVGFVGQCVQPVGTAPGTPCTDEDPATPAAAAGLEPGDRLVSYAGEPTPTWASFQQVVRSTPGSELPLVVERDGRQVTLRVSPVLTERPVFGEDGQVVVGPDGQPVTEEIRYLGLSPTGARERQPLSAVPETVGTIVWGTARVILTLPLQLVELAQATFGGQERDPAGVIGLVGVGRVAGEIAAAEADVVDRVAGQLMLLASLNVALFLFNLLPVLPLDGGHVVGALWEGGRRQLARLRGRPLPGPVDVARMMPVAYGAVVVLLGMTLLLVYADIVRPVTL